MKNTKKNTETIASAIHTDEFKKNILNQTAEKINDILKKTEIFLFFFFLIIDFIHNERNFCVPS